MQRYTKEELEKALSAVESLISKCEKAREKLKKGAPQHSLIENRIKAFYISANLIRNAMKA